MIILNMDVLTDHFRSPFHRGIPSDINWRNSRTNPVCGDEISVGLHRNEQGRFSAFQEGRHTPTSLWELKTGLLKQSGLLALLRGTNGLMTWED